MLVTAETAAAKIATLANAAIAERGQAIVVLAGGTTPAPVYRALRTGQTDFSRWTILPSDERCLPRGHPGRNDTMLRQTLVDAVPIGRFISIPAELGPDSGADALCDVLDKLSRFDVALLGIGHDGHTASLFTPAHLADTRAAVAVHDALTPPPQRVSIGAGRLNASRNVLFLVGPDKRPVVDRIVAGDNLPAGQIKADRRVIYELLDDER